MKLKLERLYLKPDYTIGKLYIDGKYFCDTLEDQVRDLAKERKIPGRTAIPAGVYEVIEYFAQVPPETSTPSGCTGLRRDPDPPGQYG